MTPRSASRLAWTLTAASAVLAAAGVTLAALAFSEPHGETETQLWANVVVSGILLGWSIIGALVASQRPENPIGWMFVLAALGMSVSVVASSYAEYSAVSSELPAGSYAAWLTNWLWGVSAIVVPVVVFLIFPNGRFLSPLWKWTTLFLLLVAAGTFSAEAARPGTFDAFPTIENPLGIESGLLDALVWLSNHLLGPVVMVFVIASLVVRLHRSTGDERAQIKWVVYAAAIACGSFLLAFVGGFEIAFLIALAALAAVPVAAGVGILRYRLYDIDLLIRRTLVYGVLTALLAGLYFGIVLAFQQVFSAFAGGSDLAIAISTLAVAALFRPVRGRIQRLVDRRFFRQGYDAQQTLEAFSSRLRDEVDLEALGADLAAVIHETMHPVHASLWLRPQGENR